MKRFAFALAGLALLATPSLGDRLDPATIPHNAHFLVHLDLAGFQKTELWKTIEAHPEMLGDEDPFAELAKIEQEFGMHPLHDVASVTLFAAQPDPESAVAMIRCSDGIEGILSALQQEEGYVRVEAKGLEIHVFEAEGESVYAYLHGHGDYRTVLASPNQRELVRSALVLRGEQPSLADNEENPLNLKPRSGAFLFAAVAGKMPEDLLGFEPASQLFEKAEALSFNLGERDGELFAHLGVTTDSEATAQQIMMIAQGAMAFAGMAAREIDELPEGIPMDLLSSLDFDTRGKTVSVEFSYETKALFELAHQLGGF